jgi:hypothetical protein
MKATTATMVQGIRTAIETKAGGGVYHHCLDEDWRPKFYPGIRADVANLLKMKQGKLFHRRFQRAAIAYFLTLCE